MQHADYKAMIHQQEQTRDNAWRFVLQNMGSAIWMPIPKEICLILGFHHSLGMLGGMLVTRAGAQGVSEFIQRMNRAR